jgi:transposase
MLLKVAVGTEKPIERSFLNDRDSRLKMVEFLMQFARKHGCSRIVFVYEASGQGFGLYDLLTSFGIECLVLSPAHLAKSAKQKKNKTDAKDAEMLLEKARAYVLAGSKLPIVWTPPKALRDDRELVRFRLETAEAGTRVKLQIFSMLKRYGIPTPAWFQKNRSWTRRFVKWLKEQTKGLSETVSPVLMAHIERFEFYQAQITSLDRCLRQLAKTPRYEKSVEALRGLRGVGLITALTFLTEMGDLTRFGNRREVAAYLGLSPSSFETGEANDRKGHITRQGPSRVRKVLCQAAWAAVRLDPATYATWERIQGGKPGRGKKAIVAIMRKLAIVMWHRALALGVPIEFVSQSPGPPSWVTPIAQAG